MLKPKALGTRKAKAMKATAMIAQSVNTLTHATEVARPLPPNYHDAQCDLGVPLPRSQASPTRDAYAKALRSPEPFNQPRSNRQRPQWHVQNLGATCLPMTNMSDRTSTPNQSVALDPILGRESAPTPTPKLAAWKTYAAAWKTYAAAWMIYAGTWTTYAAARMTHAGRKTTFTAMRSGASGTLNPQVEHEPSSPPPHPTHPTHPQVPARKISPLAQPRRLNMPPAAVGCPTARPPLTTLLAALALLLTLIVTPAARAQNCDPGWLPGAGATGMNDWVFALAVLPGGDLITGGQFTTAGGVGANRIARYNTTTGVWSALGSGMNSSVSGFAALPVGDVIVGGYFTRAGGVAANRIARYNPTTGVWSALGSGMNDAVRAVAVLPGGDVIAGGFFTTAGGVAANYIAR